METAAWQAKNVPSRESPKKKQANDTMTNTDTQEPSQCGHRDDLRIWRSASSRSEGHRIFLTSLYESKDVIASSLAEVKTEKIVPTYWLCRIRYIRIMNFSGLSDLLLGAHLKFTVKAYVLVQKLLNRLVTVKLSSFYKIMKLKRDHR
jgi:hypothetical protein